MFHGIFVCALVASAMLPGPAASRAPAGTPSSDDNSNTGSQIVLAAHSGAAAHGRMGPAGHVGSPARLGRPAAFPRFPRRPFPFRPLPFRPFPFQTFIGFGFAAPFFLGYDTYYPYPYNPYCDPVSGYYYPPWCT